MQEVIKVEQLAKIPTGNCAQVEHISLAVDRGMVFGLLGANGAGKSTTLNASWEQREPTQVLSVFWEQTQCKTEKNFLKK